MKVRQALDMAAANPMVKNALMGMIPQALSAVCGAADQAEKGGGGITIPGLPFQESKKLTKNTLKQLIKEEYRSSVEARRNLGEMRSSLKKDDILELLRLIWRKEDEEYESMWDEGSD